MHECIQHGVSAWYERGYYTCLKVRGLAGGSLSRAEADFAGLYEPKQPSGGWHAPDLPVVWDRICKLFGWPQTFVPDGRLQ